MGALISEGPFRYRHSIAPSIGTRSVRLTLGAAQVGCNHVLVHSTQELDKETCTNLLLLVDVRTGACTPPTAAPVPCHSLSTCHCTRARAHTHLLAQSHAHMHAHIRATV